MKTTMYLWQHQNINYFMQSYATLNDDILKLSKLYMNAIQKNMVSGGACKIIFGVSG